MTPHQQLQAFLEKLWEWNDCSCKCHKLRGSGFPLGTTCDLCERKIDEFPKLLTLCKGIEPLVEALEKMRGYQHMMGCAEFTCKVIQSDEKPECTCYVGRARKALKEYNETVSNLFPSE